MSGHPDLGGLGIQECKLNQEIPDTQRCLVIQTWEVWASRRINSTRNPPPIGSRTATKGSPGLARPAGGPFHMRACPRCAGREASLKRHGVLARGIQRSRPKGIIVTETRHPGPKSPGIQDLSPRHPGVQTQPGNPTDRVQTRHQVPDLDWQDLPAAPLTRERAPG